MMASRSCLSLRRSSNQVCAILTTSQLKNAAAEPGFSCHCVGIPIRGSHRSQLAEQDQDQNDDDHDH